MIRLFLFTNHEATAAILSMDERHRPMLLAVSETIALTRLWSG